MGGGGLEGVGAEEWAEGEVWAEGCWRAEGWAEAAWRAEECRQRGTGGRRSVAGGGIGGCGILFGQHLEGASCVTYLLFLLRGNGFPCLERPGNPFMPVLRVH